MGMVRPLGLVTVQAQARGVKLANRAGGGGPEAPPLGVTSAQVSSGFQERRVHRATSTLGRWRSHCCDGLAVGGGQPRHWLPAGVEVIIRSRLGGVCGLRRLLLDPWAVAVVPFG